MFGEFRPLARPKIRISSLNSSREQGDDSSELAPSWSGNRGVHAWRDQESWDASIAEIFVPDPSDIVLTDTEKDHHEDRPRSAEFNGYKTRNEMLDAALEAKSNDWTKPELTPEQEARLYARQQEFLQELKHDRWMFIVK